VRRILVNDELFGEINTNPKNFVRDKNNRDRFKKCIKSVVGDIVIDVNDEVEEYGDSFDYRDKLRDQNWVENLGKRLVADYLKQVKRNRIDSFGEEWKKAEK
jgi:hypothetical protein